MPRAVLADLEDVGLVHVPEQRDRPRAASRAHSAGPLVLAGSLRSAGCAGDLRQERGLAALGVAQEDYCDGGIIIHWVYSGP